MYSQSEI